MRARDLLLEFNIAKTSETIGKKLYDRMSMDSTSAGDNANSYAIQKTQKMPKEGLTAEQKRALYVEAFNEYALGEIQKFDSAHRGKYTLWMVRAYLSNGIRLWEDFSRAEAAVTHFHDIKQGGYFKRNPDEAELADINKFKTLSDLETFVRRVLGDGADMSNSAKDRALEHSLIESGQAIVLADTDDLKIVIPKSEEAACFFGRNTSWCTASTISHNAFDSYNAQGDLYIILHKPTNRRWQFHFESQQYMDERDNSIQSFDDFPMEAFEYIPFGEMSDETKSKLLGLENAEEDGAGLPATVLHKILDTCSKGLVSFALLESVRFLGYDHWVRFLKDYIDKRFYAEREFIPRDGILNLNRDFLAFLYIASGAPGFRAGRVPWLTTMRLHHGRYSEAFDEITRRAHYTVIYEGDETALITVVDPGVIGGSRFTVFFTGQGHVEMGDDAWLKDWAKSHETDIKPRGSIQKLWAKTVRYLTRYLPPPDQPS